jgi:hypothetical protein
MSVKTVEPGAVVNIEAPDDEHTMARLDIMLSIAKTCEKLADALNCPVQNVTINGNITANVPYGVRAGKRPRRDV